MLLKWTIASLLLTTGTTGAEVGKKNPFEFGDKAFKERRIKTRAFEALKFYRAMYKTQPKNPEAAWRLSMICYFIGIRHTPDEKRRAKIYAEGRDAGEVGVKQSKKCAPCYFWTAINMALYGETVGVVKMLFSLRTIMDHLERSIQLDPKYAYAGAHRLLGMIRYKLPGLLGGSNSKAKKHFEDAIKFGPDEPLNYLGMVELLDQGYEDRQAAIVVAKRALQLPAPSKDRLEARDALKEIKKFLKKHNVMPGATSTPRAK